MMFSVGNLIYNFKMPDVKSLKSHFEVLKITNITTNVDICQKNQFTTIEVVNCEREHFGIILPKPAGSGLLVNIEAKIIINEEQINFIATGKIEEVKEISKDKYYVKFVLKQYNPEEWLKYFTAIEKERNRIEHLFKSLKGEDT